MHEFIFDRQASEDQAHPGWLLHIWRINQARADAGMVEPFSGTPKLADAPDGSWTEDYASGARVIGTAHSVTLQYP